MKSLNPLYTRLIVLFIWIVLAACQSKTYKVTDNSYSGLLTVFHDFDRLRQPKIVEGIPDYSEPAMEAQLDSLKILQAKLSRMDTAGWRKDQQIDYRLMEAHLHGMEFNHTIMHRWSSDPAYYSTIGWFNPTMEGALYLPHLPIPEKQLPIFKSRLEVFPLILAAAKKNLTQMTPDLAQLGIRRKLWEEEQFKEWLPKLAQTNGELLEAGNAAVAAIIDFRKWLEEKKPTLTGTSGIGIENYNWLLRNVYLSPYTWEQCITITQRELERSLALLKLEEFKNRNLPPLPIIQNQAQFDSVHQAGQEWLIQFIRNNDILPQPDYLHTKSSGGWSRPTGRNFFENILDRDPLPLLPHDMVGHSPDAQREEMWNKPPFPRAYDPFYVSGTRAEALATGMEENLMSMGMLDQRPRSRELTYMLRIFRAVRALADLRMHSNEFTLEQAMAYAMKTVPYGWYNQNTYLIWEEMDLYLRQPGYGVGYLMGSVQLEQLISRQSMKLAEKFEFKKFMEDFLKPGLIPISLIEWTME